MIGGPSAVNNSGQALWCGPSELAGAKHKNRFGPDPLSGPLAIYSLDELRDLNNTKIDEVLYRGTEEIRLFPNGKVESATLAGTTWINKVFYKRDTKIFLFPDGKVERGTLALTDKIAGVVYLQDTEISFYPSGQVKAGTLGKKEVWRRVTYPVGTLVEFTKNGALIKKRSGH